MAGPIEEVGETARTLVDALKSAPMVLAVLCFNVFYMITTFWAVHEAGARWERLLELALKGCPGTQ